jgi:hypothetical protein
MCVYLLRLGFITKRSIRPNPAFSNQKRKGCLTTSAEAQKALLAQVGIRILPGIWSLYTSPCPATWLLLLSSSSSPLLSSHLIASHHITSHHRPPRSGDGEPPYTHSRDSLCYPPTTIQCRHDAKLHSSCTWSRYNMRNLPGVCSQAIIPVLALCRCSLGGRGR